jgi:hypothetical protein
MRASALKTRSRDIWLHQVARDAANAPKGMRVLFFTQPVYARDAGKSAGKSGENAAEIWFG